MPVRLFGSAKKLIAMVATTLTKTTRGMHVLDIHGFSSVRKNNVTQMAFCTRRPSPPGEPTFTVGGLDWDTTDETVPLFCEKDSILFDASSEDTCTWGTGEVARRSHLHAGSRYVLGDRLKIECAIDVCGDFLIFDDPPPTPSSGLSLF
ncbi:hypothetical protein ZWY2020_009833 [Hordeum vulgare]|nr:hypothetical protein ZWY2020_009833 [Hordeum vulgare]